MTDILRLNYFNDSNINLFNPVSTIYQVLVDTAAYAPHSRLALSTDLPADFAVISFYKLFGWPTGIGALIMRKSILPLLSKVMLNENGIGRH